MAAGYDHSLAVDSRGNVWSWGDDAYGELGNGTISTVGDPTPTQIPSSELTGVSAVAAGTYTSMALTSSGSVYTWGNGSVGQLGNGTYASSEVPVKLTGLPKIVAIAAGSNFDLALSSAGTVYAWGSNTLGQLGTGGGYTTSDTPVEITGLPAGIAAIAAGGYQGMTLTSTGAVYDWGYNGTGQLGNDTTTNSATPVDVSGLSSVAAIAMGNNFAVALKSNGTVDTWGDNYYGQLGDGQDGYSGGSSENLTPASVSGLAGVVAISADFDFGMALKANGTVWDWGVNYYGELGGSGAYPDSNTPVQAQNLADVTAIANSEGNFGLALTPNGTVWGWGQNNSGSWSGQLGNGTYNNSPVPVQSEMTTTLTPGTISYIYNSDGLETAATTASGTNQVTWDTTSSLPLILSDGTNDYIYGPTGQPVEQIALATGTPTYFTYTPTDSTWITTNQAGDETGFWGYDAYGNLAFGTPTSHFGYSGQYTDTTTGLVNDRARFYSDQTGSFTTRDPDFAQTDTAYTYAGDDPVDQFDPTGNGVSSNYNSPGYKRIVAECDSASPPPGCNGYPIIDPKAIESFFAGVANQIEGFGLLPGMKNSPQLNIPNPNCQDASSYEGGEWSVTGGTAAAGGIAGGPDDAGILAPEIEGGSSDLAAPGGLAANDAAFGAHVLSHVGLSDAALAARGLSEASTFFSRAVAEASLSDVQIANAPEIQAWLAGAKPGATTAFAATFDEPVGTVLARGASQSVEGSTAIAVLRANPSASLGYYLVTGYVAP